jgi:hypothetical protein
MKDHRGKDCYTCKKRGDHANEEQDEEVAETIVVMYLGSVLLQR